MKIEEEEEGNRSDQQNRLSVSSVRRSGGGRHWTEGSSCLPARSYISCNVMLGIRL